MTPILFAKEARQRVQSLLETWTRITLPAESLQQAITYTLCNPGKRLRPQLVYLTGLALGAPWEAMDPAACAIEMIHTYSLIHDDLPAMDDASFRRGQPACHKQFSEATAILAGDALQPLAFEVLTNHPAPLEPLQRLEMARALATACGPRGMVAGQALDLAGPPKDPEALIQMYELKTGALLSVCTELGAIAAGCEDNPLHHFGRHIGLAFQIQDDLLDMEGTSAILGKMPGIDQRNEKITWPLLTSIEASRKKITELFELAITSIPLTGAPKLQLETFATQLLGRNK